jgi:alcohol dehydrogenase class IV
MSTATWTFPTKIVFGNGAVSTLADHVRAAGGRRALVVCDPGVVKAEIAERVRRALEAGGIAVMVFDKVDPNPVEENVMNGVAAFRAHQADIVVAVGGGSPLDVGKLIALKTTHDPSPSTTTRSAATLTSGRTFPRSSPSRRRRGPAVRSDARASSR